MKKRFLSIALTLAMVSSMAVGCGSSKSDSADSKKEESAKTEASADTESNQILFNGSSTLAPVITSMATTFFDTYGTWDAYDSSLPKEDIAIYVSAGGSGQGTKAVIDGTATFGMVARSVKDEEKEAIKDEKEYQVGIDALTIAVNPANPVNDVLDNLTTAKTYPHAVKQYFPDYMGLIFEKMCQDYLLYYANDLPIELSEIGQWWGTDPQKKKQIQIDIVGTPVEGNDYIIGSCKYRNEKIGLDELELIREYAAVFGKGTNYHYYIFSKGGFTDGLLQAQERGEVQLLTLADIFE